MDNDANEYRINQNLKHEFKNKEKKPTDEWIKPSRTKKTQCNKTEYTITSNKYDVLEDNDVENEENIEENEKVREDKKIKEKIEKMKRKNEIQHEKMIQTECENDVKDKMIIKLHVNLENEINDNKDIERMITTLRNENKQLKTQIKQLLKKVKDQTNLKRGYAMHYA